MPKVRKAELSFLYATSHMVYSTFLPSIIKIFQQIFDLQSRHKINGLSLSNITKGDNAKRKAELSFLCATRHLILFYISTKYHRNIPKGIQVTELTRNQWLITVKYYKGR